jgi:prophage regulatory protein
MAQPHFLLPSEVTEITRLRDPTRARMENKGLFPRRVRISPRRVGWRRTDILDWVEDPATWPSRRQSTASDEAPVEPAAKVVL